MTRGTANAPISSLPNLPAVHVFLRTHLPPKAGPLDAQDETFVEDLMAVLEGLAETEHAWMRRVNARLG